MKRTGTFAVFMLGAALIAGRGRAAEIDIVWVGGPGLWNFSSNWDTNMVPANNLNDTFNVFIDGSNPVASTVTLNVSVAINNLTLDADDLLSFDNGDDLTLDAAGGGMVSNAGMIVLNSTGGFTDLRADGGPMTLSGGGLVHLVGNTNNRILAVNGGSVVNLDNEIRGAGQIGVGSAPVSNAGTIIADEAANSLTLDPPITPIVNSGTMRAELGATLRLVSGEFTNVGGQIQALDASFVELSGATISGGTLSSSGSGLFRVTSASSLDGSASTLSLTGEMLVLNGVELTLKGTIENSGTLTLTSTGSFTNLRPSDGPVTLTGGGAVSLSNHANNRIFAAGGGSLVNADNTLAGAGQIGLGQTTISNNGTIIANLPTDLILRPDAGGLTNGGTLRADSGGTLVLQVGDYFNAGGLVEALDGSVVEMNGATLSGGTLATTGSGRFDLSDSNTLDGSGSTLTVAGTVNLLNNADVTLAGTIDNQGVITMNSTGSFTDLEPTGGPVMLTGGGELVLGNHANNRVFGVGGASLINVDNTIRGAGQLGINSLPITNQGSVVADQTIALTVDPDAVTGLDNQGTLQAAGTGGMTINPGPFTTSGTIDVAVGSTLSRSGDIVQTGGLMHVNGQLSATAGVDLQGGVLSGNGTVTAAVTNAASVEPGDSAGQLTINGAYEQTASGALAIEIGGTVPGTQFDRLVVSGMATLDGTLSVSFIDGFPPMVGQTFEVMTFASRNGTFANLALPCPGGVGVQVNVNATNVVVEIVPGGGTLGDLNCDCTVNLDDVEPFALALIDSIAYDDAFGPCVIDNADMNADLSVNAADLPGFIDALVP